MSQAKGRSEAGDSPARVPDRSSSQRGSHNRRYKRATPSSAVPTTNSVQQSTTSNDEELSCKVILLGDSGVGKTCLMVRFNDSAFQAGAFISTIGIDFRTKAVEVDGAIVQLQVWDTAGQERFRSITASYYHDADAILLCYDVSRAASFENISSWMATIRENAPRDVVILLLGNKADVSSGDRHVSQTAGNQLAKDHNIPILETSAKTGMNVDLAFEAVARAYKSRHDSAQAASKASANFNLEDYVEKNSIKPSCNC